MRIAVIDDQPADRDYIAALVSRWAKDRDVAMTAVPFPSAEAFLFAYSENKDFDILHLDIEMGAINGVELGENGPERKRRRADGLHHRISGFHRRGVRSVRAPLSHEARGSGQAVLRARQGGGESRESRTVDPAPFRRRADTRPS